MNGTTQMTARVPNYVFSEVESLIGYGKPYNSKKHFLDCAIATQLRVHSELGKDSDIEVTSIEEICSTVKKGKTFGQRFNEKK